MRQESDTTEALLEKDGVIQYVGTLEEAEALCDESVHKIRVAPEQVQAFVLGICRRQQEEKRLNRQQRRQQAKGQDR